MAREIATKRISYKDKVTTKEIIAKAKTTELSNILSWSVLRERRSITPSQS